MRIFESYGRSDASELAARLRRDLEAHDFEVWQDIDRLHGGALWDEKIREALSNSEAVVAILSPHATRTGAGSSDRLDSVCLDEIAFARFSDPPRPIVPVMALACEPPLTIYRLHCIDMQGWEADEPRYLAAFDELLRSIDLARRGEPALRGFVGPLNPDQKLTEVLDTAAFLENKRQNFTGRAWLFAEIDGWLEHPGERALLITGDPGAGKSALVAELVHRNPGGQVVAYHCCIADLPDTLSAGKFVPNLAAMLASQVPGFAQAIDRGGALERLRDAERDPASAFQFGVIAPLASLPAPPHTPRYILIDGLDEALSGEAARAAVTIPDLLSSQLGTFPAWLRLVATTRRRRSVLERFGGVREVALSPSDERNLADVRVYLDARLKAPELAALVARSAFTGEQILGRLAELADGSFIYAKHAADALAHGSLDLGQLERQPPGLASLYEVSFAHTFEDPELFAACAQVLAVLLAARRSLRRDQLGAILGLAAVELERRLTPLEPYLARIDAALAVFHKSLADWLMDPSIGTTRFHVDPADGEPQLVQWCRRWRELEDDYPLRYLPLHLANRGAVDELQTLLLDDEFVRRRRAARISRLLEIEDFAVLSTKLLEADRITDLAALAQTTSPYRRDGIALALSQAGEARQPVVRAIVDRLLAVGGGRGGDDLSPELLSARVIAIDTAAHHGYADALTAAADDPSAAVRAVLVPHLYRFWRDRGDEGWALLDSLGAQLIGHFGLPRQSQVEVTGGLSLAILTRDFDDARTVARLGEFWRVIVRRVLASKLVRAAGKRLALKAALAALTVVMRNQPEYQPLNLNELRHTFSAPAEHRPALAALDALERPVLGCDGVVEVLLDQTLEFDVFLMAVAERALVVQGARDPGATIDAIERIYRDGCPWFRQSCLYSAFHTLQIAHEPDSAWLDRYGQLTDEFVAVDHAGLRTAVGTYSFPPHLAWAEIIFARHRPTGKARFLNRYFEAALAREDVPLCRTVIKACHLLSFAYRESQLALDALRDMVPNIPAESPLEETLVEALANIRLYEDASVDRFLRGLGDPELMSRVRAATPSVRAEEFPTWMDSFVNHQLVTSDEFRDELCEAFRRAAGVSNVRELLYDNVAWVLNMLAGERLVKARQ